MVCTPSREALLALIRPDMKSIPKEFFKRVYAFELSYPGFSEQAIEALEKAGCSRARQYYTDWVAEYEAAYSAEMKSVAAWYQKECERQWEKRQKEGEERRVIQAEAELLKRKRQLLMQKSQILTGS